ncbi:hypothetical protein HD806DRAFT_310254 [Xylariaceae sp. AK1471]|nr:hypothetical protein HD806DRAFT_310254 [Xylariaceae sp. AK1471]
MIQVSEAGCELYVTTGERGLNFEEHYSSTFIPGCSVDIEHEDGGTIGKIIARPTVNDTETEYYGITCSHVLDYNADQSQQAFSPSGVIDSCWEKPMALAKSFGYDLNIALLSFRRFTFNRFLGTAFAASTRNATLNGSRQDIALIRLKKDRVDPTTCNAPPQALINYCQNRLKGNGCVKMGSETGLTSGLKHDVIIQVTEWANDMKISDTREHAIVSEKEPFSDHGDSGSMIYHEYTLEEIGMVWGGLRRGSQPHETSFQMVDPSRLVGVEFISFYMPAQAVAQSISQFFAQNYIIEELASSVSGLSL